MSDVNYDLWHPSSRRIPERNEMDDLIDKANDLAAENARLTTELADKQERIAELERDLKIEQEIVDLFNRCIHDAGKLWHETHPDAEMYPGGSGLIVWLKEQVDALAARRCETCAHGHDWSELRHSDGTSQWFGNCDGHLTAPRLRVERSGTCHRWQGKEDADA